MALGFVLKLWPFSVFKSGDLRASHELVRNLSIPERTKQFVYAVQDPETRSIIYILSAQSLSQSSVLDVKCLIRAVKPEAVIAQVGVSQGIEVLTEEIDLEDGGENPIPTSIFEVLRRSFVDEVGKERYGVLAGGLVLKEIFGVSFHGHLLEAKRAAKEAGSSFLVIGQSLDGHSDDDYSVASSGKSDVMSKFLGLFSSLIPQHSFGSAVALSSRRFSLTNESHSQIVKLLSPHVESLILSLTPPGPIGLNELLCPEDSYEAPAFAQSIYPLLSDLHSLFGGTPSIGRALAHAQKMLHDVNKGDPVDKKIMSEVLTFRVAIEGLRTALNNAGKLPIYNKTDKTPEFSKLSMHEKSQILLAQALRAQTKNFKTTVAVVDASSLAGLRTHWNNPVPLEVKHLLKELCEENETKTTTTDQTEKNKHLLLGAGAATAVLGVSSLSKTVQASTIVKLASLKAPAHKALSVILGKTMAPAKVLKAAASAEKIQAVAHGVVATVKKTSLSAMRTAFYEIMRSRGRVRRPIGALPWATFGCSVATCSALVVYGDGIECLIESLPSAPSIASLGRGVERLRRVSKEVGQTDSDRIHKSIESLMARLKYVKIQ